MFERKEKKKPISARVIESLREDIEQVSHDEQVTVSDVVEAWLLIGQKEYSKQKPNKSNTNALQKPSKPNESNQDNEQAKIALEYFNTVTGRKFKRANEVKARLKDYTLDDVQLVIDYKAREWMGSEWQKYLRPETLFNAKKFEGYLNDAIQCVPIKPENKVTLGDLSMEEIMNGDISRLTR